MEWLEKHKWVIFSKPCLQKNLSFQTEISYYIKKIKKMNYPATKTELLLFANCKRYEWKQKWRVREQQNHRQWCMYMLYLTVAWCLPRWQRQSDYSSWENQWALGSWCPVIRGYLAPVKSTEDECSSGVKYFSSKSLTTGRPAVAAGCLASSDCKLEHNVHTHCNWCFITISRLGGRFNWSCSNTTEKFSDLQFDQKHLVIFCLNFLLMYDLGRDGAVLL